MTSTQPTPAPTPPPAPTTPSASAGAPTTPPVEGTTVDGGGDRLVRFEDGTITIQNSDGTTQQINFDPNNMIPPQVPDIIAIVMFGLVAIIMAFPIGRAIERWIDRRGQVPPVNEDLARRLAAIEQAVDTVAVEVERMSEANRFTTKLLAERIGAPDFAAGARAGDAAGVPRADTARRP
jgi:hypothetical protein